jgi:hypothetical protein
MPLATIRPMGESGLYHIHFLDGSEHPSHGLPGSPGHPDQGLPGGRPPHVSGGWPGHPDQGLPGGGSGIPDNSLPSTPPPTLLPGYTLVMVRGPAGKWEYAFIAPSDPPPKPLPPLGGGGHPDQGLPGQRPPHVSTGPVPVPPGTPANPIAPGGQPPVATQPPMPGTPLPPTQPQPTPQRR